MPLVCEGRQAQGAGEGEGIVGEDGEGEVLALGHLALVGGGLGGEAEEVGDAEGSEIGEGVAEGVALRWCSRGRRGSGPSRAGWAGWGDRSGGR